jgi:hypothetical protein
VPKAGRAAHELTGGGQLEALGDGLFGLLHGTSGRKQSSPSELARGFFAAARLLPAGGRRDKPSALDGPVEE